MEYTIISSRCKEKLINHVKDYIEDGWLPLGGHCQVVYEEEVEIGWKVSRSDDESVASMETEIRTTGCWSQSMIKGD